MPKVQLLPDALVNQIAAGEVIERPASVLKELVENSLDAGARRVELHVENGGIARISVLDDGCGMEAGDARLALERHATSKIRTLQDLERIASLGFRGEALPSIASVSRLVLTTSPDDSGLGTEVVAERGAPPRTAPARHPHGTRVEVEDLFANVPARRKFLKSPEAELKAIVRTATALALARPDVAVSLRSGARTLLELPAAADAASRFVEILGAATLGEVIPVSYTAGGITVVGAVSRPGVTFASRTYQWFFVNGRLAKDATVSHAATLAAREVFRVDRHPAFVLFLSCDPSACDVNVHPQKLEVRFRDPGAVHSAVHRALREALTLGKGAAPVSGGRLEGPPEPYLAPSREHNPLPPGAAFLAEAIGVWGPRPAQGALLAPPSASPARSAYAPGAPPADSPIGPVRLLGQYRDSFLIAEGESGLVLIDQHVAHERVRYERILERLDGRGSASQSLLVPVPFDASALEAAALHRAEELLAATGFVVSELSGRTFLVSAAPPDCPAGAVVPFLRDFLATLGDAPEGSAPGARAKEALAASLACRGAVTIHTPLKMEEAARLMADLARCRDPFTCPHGRPILLTFEHEELERRFGRRG